MFRNRIMLVSGFILFMTMLNCAEAADQNYVVSFVAGKPGLGLVSVKQTDSIIKAGQPRISRLEKTLGSTALISDWHWDYHYGYWYDVFVTYAGNAAKPIKAKRFEFELNLTGPTYEEELTHSPGQYHPLHLFQASNEIIWPAFPQPNLLAAGPFGTTRANDYVSYEQWYSFSEGNRVIFPNGANRSAATAAAAPDGVLMSQLTITGLKHVVFVRILNNQRDPVGRPFELLDVNDFQGYSQSLSNPIRSASSRTRYLAYRNFRQPGTSNSQSKVIIQKVGAKTGQPQGKPRSITNFTKAPNVEAEKFQSIAISPDGRLILYTAWNDACTKQILFARRLSNDSGVGNPTVIVGCEQLEEYPVGVYGISITEAPE